MIVLDAAALVDVVLDQPAKDWVLDQLADEVVCAPAHQPAEVLSAIARLVRRGDVDGGVAADAVREARAADQELVVPKSAHLERALALQNRIRVLEGLAPACSGLLAPPGSLAACPRSPPRRRWPSSRRRPPTAASTRSAPATASS